MKNLNMLLPGQAPSTDTWVWATVTQHTPLRVRLDGDEVSLDVTPEYLFPGEPVVGSRVWVQMNGLRVIVHGPTKGVDFTPAIQASYNSATVYADEQIALAVQSVPGDIAQAEANAKAYSDAQLAAEKAAIESSIAAGDTSAKEYADTQLAAQAATFDSEIGVIQQDVINLGIEIDTAAGVADAAQIDVTDLRNFVTKTTSTSHTLY